MTVEMPVLIIHDLNVLKKSRLNKRREKIKRNKLKPIPYKTLISLIFPNITASIETFSDACKPSKMVILDEDTSNKSRTLVCGKFKTFNEGPQILCEYLGYSDKEGDFVDEHLNIWPWLQGTRLRFISRGYRPSEGYPNCSELRFKPFHSQIKDRVYECTLPFFKLHRDGDGMFPCSDVLEVFGLPLYIFKTEMEDMIIREGELYEEQKELFLAMHPDFNPDEFYITVRKSNFCKATPDPDNSSIEDLTAEVISAEKIEAYGQKIWKLTVPWIVLDEDHDQMIPLNIYTPEIDNVGEKQEFAAGDVIHCAVFLMGRVLSHEEWEHCSLHFFGIKED